MENPSRRAITPDMGPIHGRCLTCYEDKPLGAFRTGCGEPPNDVVGICVDCTAAAVAARNARRAQPKAGDVETERPSVLLEIAYQSLMDHTVEVTQKLYNTEKREREAAAREAQLREENARLLSATREEKAHLQSAIPKECPITRRPFFMLLPSQDDPNVWVPTYGGPFDSYTIPRPDKDGNWFRERFDHDAGAWVDGSEIVDVPGADVAQHAQNVVEKARHLRHTPMSIDAAVLIGDELEKLFKAVDALDGEDNASTA